MTHADQNVLRKPVPEDVAAEHRRAIREEQLHPSEQRRVTSGQYHPEWMAPAEKMNSFAPEKDALHEKRSREELQQQVSELTQNVASLRDQVTFLATQLARRSQSQSHRRQSIRSSIGSSIGASIGGLIRREPPPPENTFTNALDEHSRLNPLGQNFDYREWVKNLMDINPSDPDTESQRGLSVAFRNLGIYGMRSATDYQKDVYSSLLSLGNVARRLIGSSASRVQILSGFDGLVESGEMLLVLGRPGSGCSTFLKTISGEMSGLYADSDSHLNYQGISADHMCSQFRGEAIYTAEQDVHFPQLTVSQTLSFAARARVPRNRLEGVSREQYAQHMKDVVIAIFGLTGCANTIVGNDYMRGVSGGERKRVSIAEATLSGSPLQSWDNSTRGLDAANAIEFCKTLRTQSDLFGRTACVAIYQAPEAAYELFDKVTLLYEGKQIYFGPAREAKRFFMKLGFECPERQTTSDFLTSLTNPDERIVRKGYEHRVPRTPEEFVSAWQRSRAYHKLMESITGYDHRHPLGGPSSEKFQAIRTAEKAKRQRVTSPYTISVPMQIKLCLGRGYQRIRADMSVMLTNVIAQVILSLVVSSVFYNMQPTTASFFGRGALLFYVTILNAFTTSIEVITVYGQRPIVEKHSRYALYHPFSEAASGAIIDLVPKLLAALGFNIPLYFMANLRREPGPFFIFFLFAFLTTQTMAMIYRTMASISKNIAQALAPSAVFTLGLTLYTGFPIPTTAMLGWSRWINYINPLAYVFEALLVNELSGRDFTCSQFFPSGPGIQTPGPNSICTTVGSLPGRGTVAGDDYLRDTFQYYPSHLWRNFGITVAFLVAFSIAYFTASEYVQAEVSKGEVLLFRRNDKSAAAYGQLNARQPGSPLPMDLSRRAATGEKGKAANIKRHSSVVHWQDVCYDVPVAKETKRILDSVDGWIKPGTCTALMGASGAGKTTLLDTIAARVRTGVISGDILVNGVPRDASFQRNCGYVQQADLHLPTSTVREALRFSAVLRQPSHIPVAERVAYVDEVLKLLDMELYANAVVGIQGEGLNVEQRKRLTIAIELVAKPQLLVILDEPTSGLDSQTAWSIMNLLDTLKAHGQAVICTIHQPSATIFQRFDRLLLLAKGKTIYFGEVGKNSSKLVDYFERNGSPKCPPAANPAEWMLEVIGAAPGTHAEQDWSETWRQTPDYREVQRHLAELRERLPHQKHDTDTQDEYAEFAATYGTQIRECGKRIFTHYWRTPSYIYSKLALSVISALFIGFTFFNTVNSIQGIQNQILSVFMLMTIFNSFIQQIIPSFIDQRNLFESRESPARIYTWWVFILVQIAAELAWNSLVALLMFFTWYYPIGLYHNASTMTAVADRGGLMFLLVWAFMTFTSTFALFIAAGFQHAEEAGNIGGLLYSLCLTFCGVLASPQALPGFWIFMYRVSPFTYLVSGMVSDALGQSEVQCSDVEMLHFPPPSGATCQQYLGAFLKAAGGTLQNPGSNTTCIVCPQSETDSVLAQFNIYFSDRWRNFGLVNVYVVFNILAALSIYWLARVPRSPRGKQSKANPSPTNPPSEKPFEQPPRQYSDETLRSTSRGSDASTEVSNDDRVSLLPPPEAYHRRYDRSGPTTPYSAARPTTPYSSADVSPLTRQPSGASRLPSVVSRRPSAVSSRHHTTPRKSSSVRRPSNNHPSRKPPPLPISVYSRPDQPRPQTFYFESPAQSAHSTHNPPPLPDTSRTQTQHRGRWDGPAADDVRYEISHNLTHAWDR